MVGFASDMDGVDIVLRLDLALAIDLTRVRVDVAEAVPDHSCRPIARRHIKRTGKRSVSTTAAGRALAAADARR
jgi:hypothetical protein